MSNDRKNSKVFSMEKFALIRQELEENGLEGYADIVYAILSERFEEAEKLIEEGQEAGTLDPEDDVYALFMGMIFQAKGMDAIENHDDSADSYLRKSLSFFISARERGLDIPPVLSAIHTLNLVLGNDDGDEFDDMFDTDAIDYLGFKKEFPKGREFKVVLRMPQEDFSIDEIKQAYEDDWDEKLRSKKGRQNTWTLNANGVSIHVEYRKCVETIPPEELKYFTGNISDDVIEKLMNPSVARVTLTALVGDESSYERSIEFTKVVGALLATHKGVSLVTGNKVRDPEEALEAIESYPDDEWLAFILNVGFAVEGNAAMSNTAIVSDGMADFGFPEIIIRRIGPDDFDNASAFMLNLIKYIFQFGLGEPSNGVYYDTDGLRYELKKHKKSGREIIDIVLKHHR